MDGLGSCKGGVGMEQKAQGKTKKLLVLKDRERNIWTKKHLIENGWERTDIQKILERKQR